MKTISLLIFSFFFFFSCVNKQEEKKKEQKENLKTAAAIIIHDIYSTPYSKVIPVSGTMSFSPTTGSKGSKTFSYNPSCSGVPGNEQFYFFEKKVEGSKNLLINFMGGGACWDAKNCFGTNTVTYFNQLSRLNEVVIKYFAFGVFNDSQADNPLRSYNKIFIPYCTGDIHWGSNDTEYTHPSTGEKITLKHRGFDNFLATLDYIIKNYPSSNIEKIVVMGQSAGGYGAIFNYPYIREKYSNSKFYLLSDASNGVTSASFNKSYLDKWNALKNIPDWISGINSTTFTSISMGTVFKSIAENYSSDRISQYTTMFDGNQRYFYNVMLTIDSGKAYEDTKAMWGSSEGINVPDSISCDWKSKMLSNINTANAAISDNYRYYIAPGDVHTITTDDTMFTVSSGTNNSVKFTDWLNAMLTDSSDWVNTKCSSCNPPASTENKLSALCP